MTGYRVDEFLGASFPGFPARGNEGHDHAPARRSAEGQGDHRVRDRPYQRKTAPRIIAEINLSPVMKGSEVTGDPGIARDITERKMAEEALLEEKERLSITLRSIAEGVIATDIKWRIHLMNKAAEDLTGWRQDEVLGRILNDVFILIDQKTGAGRSLHETGRPGRFGRLSHRRRYWSAATRRNGSCRSGGAYPRPRRQPLPGMSS